MRHERSSAALLLGVFLLGGLGKPALTAHAQRRESSGLTGIWTMALHVASPGWSSKAQALEGQIALVPADARRSLTAAGERMTHIGVHNLKLDMLRVTLTPLDQESVVGSQTADGGPVVIVISPGPDHGSMILQGTVHGDSVTGSWYVTAYAAGNRGTFVMKRLLGT